MQVPAPFDYARATSVEEALALLDRLGPEARLIAGGHSLLPMMKLRLATPEHLIDINPRVVDMAEFQQGPFATAVGVGEMLVEVSIPLREHAGSAYEKVERRAGDWAIAAAAAMVQLDGPDVGDAGISLTAVGAHAPRLTWAEDALRGRPPSEEAFAEAARRASQDCDPIADQRGPADYKRHLARELTLRALRRAAERALAE